MFIFSGLSYGTQLSDLPIHKAHDEQSICTGRCQSHEVWINTNAHWVAVGVYHQQDPNHLCICTVSQYSQDVEKMQHHHNFLFSLLQSRDVECPCCRLPTFSQPPAVQCWVFSLKSTDFSSWWFSCSERAGERLQNDSSCPAQLLLTGANEG